MADSTLAAAGDDGRRTRASGPWRVRPAVSLFSFVAAAALLSSGCAYLKPAREPVSVGLLAVLPVEPAAVPGGSTRPAVGVEVPDPLPEDAAMAVTAQIYGTLAERPEFRFVPDLTVSGAMDSAAVRQATDRHARALALGRAVGAADVLCGTVSRFRERVGTAMGARSPASVSFDLELINVATGAVTWRGSFDETQQALSSNLFKYWMFWEAGPHWFTARELAGLGAQNLISDLVDAAR